MSSIGDIVQQLYRGALSPPPVARLIGFTLTAMQPGQAVIELEATAQHANPMGTLHGGILCDIADAAMGTAYASRLAKVKPSPQLLSHIISQIASSPVFCCNTTDRSTTISRRYERRRA